MGRELKRVPLDFNWPLDKTWEGYINPFYSQQIKCPHCDGTGSSPEYQRLESLWYSHKGGGFKPEDRGSIPYLPDHPLARAWAERQCSRSPEYYGSDEWSINREAERICAIWNSSWSHHLNDQDVTALIKADRLWDFTRTPRTDKQRALVAKRVATGKHNSWLPRSNGYIPTAREVNDWSLFGMGHDSSNCWIVLKAELKRLKQPHSCAHCKGHGHTWPSDRVRRQCSAWKQKQPPKGEGYQVWETVSEGSPISPVFSTPQDLANHMSTTRWGADEGSSPEQWMKFIMGPGWAPSMMSGPHTGGRIVSGIEAIE